MIVGLVLILVFISVYLVLIADQEVSRGFFFSFSIVSFEWNVDVAYVFML